MKKKSFALMAVSLAVLVIVLNYEHIETFFMPTSRRALNVRIMAAESLDHMLGKRTQQEKAELPFFNEQQVIYDEISNTIYIAQSLTDKDWKGILTPKTGKLYLKEDDYLERKRDAIEEGHVFELYQIGKRTYGKYQLVFTGMPIMSLSVQSSYEKEGREEQQAMMYLQDPYHSEITPQTAECTFHIRGGWSRLSEDYEKRSYRLTLTDGKQSLLGMRRDDDWILNGLYDDAGLIHNKISYEVWREIAQSNQVMNDEGTTMEYLELFINNEYAGVYGLMERVDKKELALREKDILYKCRADRIPEAHNFTNEDTDGEKPIFVLKYPAEFGEEAWEPIKAWSNMFCKEEFDSYEEGAALLDMENAIDYNLYCLLISGTDNMRKNIFFIAEYQNDGTYLMKKVPWDLNGTWGNPAVYVKEANWTLYTPELIEDVETWCTDINTLYFYDEERISGLLLERWKELRQKVITPEHISDLLDAQFSYLYATGAYERNYAKYPHGAEYWKDEYIYEYVRGRIAFLDCYFEKLYRDVNAEIIYDGVDYSEEFNARYYWEHNKETLQELYDFDEEVLLEHYVLYGKPFGLVAKRQEN